MQRLEFFRGGVGLRDDPLGFLANGAFQPAQGLVFIHGQASIAAEALVEPAQRERQQGQRIAGAGIVHHGLDQAVVELQPGQPRRALDDRRKVAQRHRVHGHRLIAEMVRVFAVLQHRMVLEFAEKVGAQGGDRHQPPVRRFERGPQQAQKARGRLRGTVAEQLFRLVDGQQHRGFGLLGGNRQIPGELQQGQAVHGVPRRRRVQLGPNRAPVARLSLGLERRGQRHGQLVERLDLGPERRHRQPFGGFLPEPGDDARPRQRRLAAARGAEQEHEAGRLASLAPQRVQGFERLEDFFAAAEEDCRVRFLKGHEARIRGAFGVPVEDIQRIEPPFQETDLEPAIALLRLGREVDVLNVAEDTARLAGLHLDRKDRLAALPRLHQFRKTPFGGQPVRRQQRNHRLALAQLLIERLLPAAAAFDSRLRVEIEKQRSMALRFQPGLHLRRRWIVGAAVTDEYRGHLDPLSVNVSRLPLRAGAHYSGPA